MDDPPLREFLVLLGLILVNGFFSLSEMSIVSSRKARLKAQAAAGKRSYRKALAAAERPARFLSTIQIAITLIGILAGAFGGATLSEPLGRLLAGAPLLAPYADALSVGIVVLGITFFSIVLGELVPKQAALANPEATAAAVVPVLELFAVLFKPAVIFLSRSTGAVLKLLRIREAAGHSITEEELRMALMEGEKSGIVQKQERSMVEGVFYLGDRPVETFMAHRSELLWLDLGAGPEAAKDAAIGSKHQTFFPVADGGLDEVVGIVSAVDILSALLEKRWKGLRAIMKKPCFVPGTMSALKAFEAFKRTGDHYLLVMDEYGGLAGALSIRDLIEEIVGELSTPDRDSEDIIKREDGSYLVGGMVNIDEIAEVLALKHLLGSHHEYHTLAGFILELAGAIPRTGETYERGGFRFEIVDMDGNRIDKVIIRGPAADLESAGQAGDGGPDGDPGGYGPGDREGLKADR